jgi:glutamate/tyrosine decarboxylase-like PLP-dependent enzyme
MDEEKKMVPGLDPRDWDATRQLAHEMVDDVFGFLQNIREQPVWQPLPQEVKDYLERPLPLQGLGEQAAYQAFKENIFPHPLGNIHPRFWGWVMGSGVPFGVLAEFLAAAMNPNLGGGEHVANYVERQVVDWCKQMLGFPRDASGLLVSGGSMANFVGLSVARNAGAGYDVRADGVCTSSAPMTLYASSETHSSIPKAVEQLGLGKRNLRLVPVNEKYQVRLDELERFIRSDLADGFKPICVIGNAGTVNTGAIDDLNALADLCEEYGLWFHVDGAFGAIAAISDQLKERVSGMERADSLAFDLHKWMYLPIEVGCILVRDFDRHIATFAASPEYLSHMPRGAASGEHAWFGDLGLQLSRGFRALKVWMSLQAYGLEPFAAMVTENVKQAVYLAGLVEAHPDLELLADVPLNIVCFRYDPGELDNQSLNDLNLEILMRLQERGLAVPSYTRLDGKFAIRIANTNHRSRMEDFDFLVDKVISIGEEVLES